MSLYSPRWKTQRYKTYMTAGNQNDQYRADIYTESSKPTRNRSLRSSLMLLCDPAASLRRLVILGQLDPHPVTGGLETVGHHARVVGVVYEGACAVQDGLVDAPLVVLALVVNLAQVANHVVWRTT